MNIEELLNKYFEGETSCDEERELRRFFTRGIVPEHLEMYRPLFAFLEAEKQQVQTTIEEAVPKRKTPLRRRILYGLSGIAAGLVLLLGVAGTIRHFTPRPENYVIIDGKQYTDAKLVQEQALAAFQEVSFSQEEVFDILFEE